MDKDIKILVRGIITGYERRKKLYQKQELKSDFDIAVYLAVEQAKNALIVKYGSEQGALLFDNIFLNTCYRFNYSYSKLNMRGKLYYSKRQFENIKKKFKQEIIDFIGII